MNIWHQRTYSNEFFNPAPEEETILWSIKNALDLYDMIFNLVNVHSPYSLVASISFKKVLVFWKKILKISALPDKNTMAIFDNYQPIWIIEKKADNNFTKIITNFECLRHEEGSYAEVCVFLDKYYNIRFIKKTLKKIEVDNPTSLKRFKREFEIMNGYTHINIVKAYKYNAEQNFYIAEYCDSTIDFFLKEKKPDFQACKKLCFQFLRSVKFLWKNGILHRDLSPSNILITKNDNEFILKISDFGLAKEKDSFFTESNETKKGVWADPQMDSFKKYGEKNEVYAISKGIKYIFKDHINNSSHCKLNNYLSNIFKFSPEKRPTIATLINDIHGIV